MDESMPAVNGCIVCCHDPRLGDYYWLCKDEIDGYKTVCEAICEDILRGDGVFEENVDAFEQFVRHIKEGDYAMAVDVYHDLGPATFYDLTVAITTSCSEKELIATLNRVVEAFG